jgi:phage terminase large subunit
VAFSANLQGAIYADALTKAQQDQRIVTDMPHDSGMLTQVGLDLGMTGAAVIGQGTPRGTWINICWAWAWEDKSLPEVIATIRALPYGVGHWSGPHDLEQRSDVTGDDRLTTARRLGVHFTVVPRVTRIEERIDLVRRKFPMLRFDARGSAPLLEALQHYRRRWNDKLKTFDAEPVHDKHSHLADALGTLLGGWRQRGARSNSESKVVGLNFDPLKTSGGWR